LLDAYAEHIRIPLIVNVRADLVKEDLVKALRKANCISMCIGIESGNEKIRNKTLKKGITDKDILRTARLAKKHKVPLFSFNMVGIPGETVKNVYQTIELNRKCSTTFSTAFFSPLERYMMPRGSTKE